MLDNNVMFSTEESLMSSTEYGTTSRPMPFLIIAGSGWALTISFTGT
jgi:hypothetical protein